LKKCSFDGKRGVGGVATSYWRWFVAEDAAVGYRVYSCYDCTADLWKRMGWCADPLAHSDQDETCVKCGADVGQDDPIVWGYMYAPKSERVDIEVFLCHECLDSWVEHLRLHGTILANREQVAREASINPWSALIPTR
jgi:hypothetical protein